MNIAVVGGGWAGLSAAVRLRQYGCSVVVFEAARTLGGRARRVSSSTLNTRIDNGQHILLGAYTETLALMQELGLNVQDLFLRERLQLHSADDSFSLRAGALPAPLHLLGAILSARGLGLMERLRIIAITTRLRRQGWKVDDGMTVAQWLAQGRQSPRAIQLFWQPLCLAALNTPMDAACAQLFARVLQDSLGGPAHASDVLIPRVDLSQLWPDQVAQYRPDGTSGELAVRPGCAVRKLQAWSSHVDVDGSPFDAVVVAGNAPATHRLLQQLDPCESGTDYLSTLSAFQYLPIATLTLQLERSWNRTRPMLLLKDFPERMQYGQWLFDRSASGPADSQCLLNIVISDARAFMEHSRAKVIAATIDQVREQSGREADMPGVRNHEVIIEKRATFAAVPGLRRPSNSTPWPRIWVAGDWTDTGYPAVLEGAVRSGKEAAHAIYRTLGSRLAQ